MKTEIACPQCESPIDLDDMESYGTPFTMRCPFCRAGLKETRVTPFLLLIVLLVVPVFLYLIEHVKQFLAGYISFADKVPSVIILFTVLYPVYKLYENFNAIVIFNMGNLHLKHSYSSFWEWFQTHEDDYYDLSEERLEKLFEALSKRISKVNPGLCFDFSIDLIDSKRHFIISADGDLAVFPAVEKLVEAAPNLSCFVIIPFSQREENPYVEIGEMHLTVDDLAYTYTFHEDLLDIKIFIKNWEPKDDLYYTTIEAEDDPYVVGPFTLIDSLLGEFDRAVFIDHMELHPYEENSFLKPITTLPELIDRIREEDGIPIKS